MMTTTTMRPSRSYADLVLDGTLTSAIGSAAAARSFCSRLLPSLEAASAREMSWIVRNTTRVGTVTATGLMRGERHKAMPWDVPWYVNQGLAEADYRLKERHGLRGDVRIPVVFAWKPCE